MFTPIHMVHISTNTSNHSSSLKISKIYQTIIEAKGEAKGDGVEIARFYSFMAKN